VVLIGTPISYDFDPVSISTLTAAALMLTAAFLLSRRSFLSSTTRDVASLVLPWFAVSYALLFVRDYHPEIRASVPIARFIYVVFSLGFAWHATQSRILGIRILGDVYSFVIGGLVGLGIGVYGSNLLQWLGGSAYSARWIESPLMIVGAILGAFLSVLYAVLTWAISASRRQHPLKMPTPPPGR